MATTIKRYISAITSMDQREILPNIIDIQNNYGLCDMMNAFGRYKSSKMYKVESFVNEPLWKEGVVAPAGVTNNNTPTVTVLLTTATSPNRRTNDTVMLATGKNATVHQVTYAGADATLVLKSVDGTNLSIAASDKLKFFSNSVGEKSIGRESLFLGATYYYQLLQTFRDTHAVSDVALLSKVEAPASGVYNYKEYAEKWLKLKAEVDAAHLAGQISVSEHTTATNALVDPDGGGNKQYERGLYQYITSYGVNDDITTAGAPTLTGDFAIFINLLRAKKASGKYDVWGAGECKGRVEDHLKNLGSSGVTSARMNMDGKSLNFMVDSMTYRGFDLQMFTMPFLDQPDLFANTPFDNGLFWIPQGRAKVADREGNSSYEPRIQIRYKPMPKSIANKGSDIWAEKHSGMFSDVNSEGEVAEARVNWITTQAIQVLGAQHFGYMGKLQRA